MSQRRLKGETPRFRFLRPRTILYAGVLAACQRDHAVQLFDPPHPGPGRAARPQSGFCHLGRWRGSQRLHSEVDEPRGEARASSTSRSPGSRPAMSRSSAFGKVVLPAALQVDPDKVRTLRVLITVARPNLRSGPQTGLILAHRSARMRPAHGRHGFRSGGAPMNRALTGRGVLLWLVGFLRHHFRHQCLFHHDRGRNPSAARTSRSPIFRVSNITTRWPGARAEKTGLAAQPSPPRACHPAMSASPWTLSQAQTVRRKLEPALAGELRHPADENRDRTLDLKETAPGRYQADLANVSAGSWDVMVSSGAKDAPFEAVAGCGCHDGAMLGTAPTDLADDLSRYVHLRDDGVFQFEVAVKGRALRQLHRQDRSRGGGRWRA